MELFCNIVIYCCYLNKSAGHCSYRTCYLYLEHFCCNSPKKIIMRGSRNFRQGGGGGGGGPGQSDKKKALTFFFFFFSPQLILQKSNGQFQTNLSFFKVPEGVQHFPRGSNFFQGGSNCLFPIETCITCDFYRGGPDPLPPPLDPHLIIVVIKKSCCQLQAKVCAGSTG